MLQQFSPITIPFVRKLVCFRQIAGWARNYDIFGTVRSAPAERDNMIDVVILSNKFSAPIAVTFLSVILCFNVMLGNGPSGVQFPGSTFEIVFSHFFGMIMFIFAIAFSNLFLIGAFPSSPMGFSLLPMIAAILISLSFYPFSILSVISPFLYFNLCGMSFSIFFHPAYYLFSVPLIICPIIFLATFLAAGSKSVGVSFFTGKVFRCGGFILTAFGASFQRGIHSVSLSPSRILGASGGANVRFSGATLDAGNYYSILAGKCELA